MRPHICPFFTLPLCPLIIWHSFCILQFDCKYEYEDKVGCTAYGLPSSGKIYHDLRFSFPPTSTKQKPETATGWTMSQVTQKQKFYYIFPRIFPTTKSPSPNGHICGGKTGRCHFCCQCCTVMRYPHIHIT